MTIAYYCAKLVYCVAYEDKEMELLTTEELAKRWKCSPDSLVNERVAGTGAPYIKVGRKVRYRLADVQAFEDRNRVTAGSPKRGVGK